MSETKVKLHKPWGVEREETWIDGLRRACRSASHSTVRRQLPLSPENVLALIEDAQGGMLEALKELLRVDDEWHGSVNSEMAHARNQARAAIEKAEK